MRKPLLGQGPSELEDEYAFGLEIKYSSPSGLSSDHHKIATTPWYPSWPIDRFRGIPWQYNLVGWQGCFAVRRLVWGCWRWPWLPASSPWRQPMGAMPMSCCSASTECTLWI